MRASFRLILLVAFASVGCGPTVDVTQGLQVLDLSTGWHDEGIVDGKNKLVPTLAFKLKNVSDQPLSALQVNAVFRRVNGPEEWGARFLSVTREALQPGATTDVLTLRSQLGYTGTEPRAEMLKNSQFVDAKVDLFAKYGSVQWKRMAEYFIQRQLIAK